ncbi:MAG: hypothetical protein EXR79_11485 [Myxococcales bacterium]|nr:hypothetical protein [Myxococcales bacterium]
MKLPPAQKAAVLAAVLAVLGIGMYFFAVDPELARGDEARVNVARVEADIQKLAATATPEELDRLRTHKDELIDKDKENRKMLPTADEIPDFIETVQRDARRVGLAVTRFDCLPGTTSNYYNAVPVKVIVEGPMRNLIQFLQVYAGGERRVINIRDLAIDQAPIDAALLDNLMRASSPLEDATVGRQATSPELAYNAGIDRALIAKAHSKVRATFTAFAFVWTGKAMPVDAEKSSTKSAKRKRT